MSLLKKYLLANKKITLQENKIYINILCGCIDSFLHLVLRLASLLALNLTMLYLSSYERTKSNKRSGRKDSMTTERVTSREPPEVDVVVVVVAAVTVMKPGWLLLI